MSGKLLWIDIETAPSIAHVWSLFNVNVSLAQLQEPGRTLCFAAKFQGDKKMHFYSEWQQGHEVMVQAAHDLMSQADTVAHYNGSSFDVPVLNREFVLAGLAPPAPFQQLDYYRTVKRRFRFTSGKLAHVADQLGIGNKVSHEGHGLWVKVLAGDPDAQKRFEKYCRQDVALLERLHDRLKPWLINPPNARLTNGEGCPVCGADALRKEGFALTQVGRFQRYSCGSCGAWSRDTTRTKDEEQVSGTTIRGLV